MSDPLLPGLGGKAMGATPQADLGYSVQAVLDAWASSAPTQPALLAPGRPPSAYRELAERTAVTTKALEDLGIRPGHRIVTALPDTAETAALFLALVGTAVCCPINPLLTEAEIDAYFAALCPAAVVVQQGLSATVRSAARRAGIAVIELIPHPTGPAGVFTLRANTHIDGRPFAGTEVVILPTSGTTAGAKLVPLETSTMLAGARASGRAYGIDPTDCRLNVMPLFHVQGLVGSVLTSLVAGSSIVCCPSFDPALTLRWIEEYGITWMSGSPTMHRAVMEVAQNMGRPGAGSLRFVRAGSAPLTAELMAELERFWGVPVIESYGMTEAHQIASNPLPPDVRKAGTVGRPTGSEVSIVDEDMQPLGPGQPGEILVRGDNVISRYLASDEVNRSSFMDGWLRTGDVGFFDEDGYLTITDRLKEIIIRGGEKVSPREVDRALEAHPAIVRAVTFGYPHPTLTQEVGAAVLLKRGEALVEADLQRFVGERLARYKIPKRIVAVDEMPAGPTGKIQRNRLAEEYAMAWNESQLESAVESSRERPPKGPLEAALVGIWAQALNCTYVRVEDDFFELGGDSLTGTMLLGMVREVLGHDISAIMMYEEANTVARMAALIERSRAGGLADA